MKSSARHRRNVAVTGGVVAAVVISPVLAGLAVGESRLHDVPNLMCINARVYSVGLEWTRHGHFRLPRISLKLKSTSPDIMHVSKCHFHIPKFEALSNGERIWALAAVPHAHISILHGKF
jgi:hypothetical protein